MRIGHTKYKVLRNALVKIFNFIRNSFKFIFIILNQY